MVRPSKRRNEISHLVHYSARFLLAKIYLFLLVLIIAILFILLYINVFIISIYTTIITTVAIITLKYYY